jgi:hypothetical protein
MSRLCHGGRSRKFRSSGGHMGNQPLTRRERAPCACPGCVVRAPGASPPSRSGVQPRASDAGSTVTCVPSSSRPFPRTTCEDGDDARRRTGARTGPPLSGRVGRALQVRPDDSEAGDGASRRWTAEPFPRGKAGAQGREPPWWVGSQVPAQVPGMRDLFLRRVGCGRGVAAGNCEAARLVTDGTAHALWPAP